MTRTRTINLVTGLALALVALAAAPAAAGDRAESKVSLRHEGDALKGKVRSDAEECVANRKVKLYQSGARRHLRAPYFKVDSTRANDKGKYRFEIGGIRFTSYYVTISDTGKCLGYRSRTVNIGPGGPGTGPG